MKPDSKKGFIYLKMMMMKIPITVLGGLQYTSLYFSLKVLDSFNTDNGIRKATIAVLISKGLPTPKFQYR